MRRPATTIGAVFSRGGFTAPARILAQYMMPQTILLWDGPEIEWALSRGSKAMVDGLRKKYRRAVEEGIPDFNLATGEEG